MALSVSAFPEHIQARHPNEVLATADDGNSRNPVTAPRILGFFGGVSSGVAGKKPEPHSSPRLGARDDEPDGLNALSLNSPLPTVPISPTFQLLPQNEKTTDFGEHANTARAPRRPQPSPFARKTTPSPIHFGAPSAPNRLEIGVATRNLPLPTHIPSKSVTQLAQPWSSSEAGQTSRPLPILPSSTSDSFKAGFTSSPSSSGSLSFKSASPIIIPSRSASGPSKHTNALPSPPNYSLKQPGSATRSRKASLPSIPPSISTPSSKVLLTQQPRGHNANTPSVSMRYQPLVVDLPSGDTSTPASSPPKQTNDFAILAPSAIRPLPRLPPSCINFGLPSFGVITNGPNSTSPAHTPFKRPRTSPSSFSGFSGLTSSTFALDPRSAFDNIPSSWASKPSGLSSSRPSSPPSRSAGILRTTTTTTTTVHSHRPPSLKLPRARSLSRTRRERSLDSYTRLSHGIPRTPPGSGGMTTPLAMGGGFSRSLTVGRYGHHGVRPLAKRPNVTPTIMGRQQERRDSLSARDLSAGSALGTAGRQANVPSLSRNTSLRHVRPQCPSGPVVRTRSVRATSAGASSAGKFNGPSSPNLASQDPSILDPPTIQISDLIADTDSSDLHIHPLETTFGTDDQSLSAESPIDSPLEFFVDGPETDVTSTNRSPSPMQYALPPDGGELSDWASTNDGDTTDDELGGVSSSTSNSRGFAMGRRRRTQLRSYRMEYKPQLEDRLVHDLGRKWSFELQSSFPRGSELTIQDMPKPARKLPVPPKTTSRDMKKGKEENKKWSFGDFTSMSSLSSPSTPGTRTSSPERKGRSRQPRRLAEAVSLALGSGNRDVTVSHSRSGRGSVSGPSQPPLPFAGLSSSHANGVRTSGGGGGGGGVPIEYEVLDIRLPSLEGKDESCQSRSPSPLDFRIPDFSSTFENSSSDTSIVIKKSRVSQDSPRSDSGRSDVHWVTKEGKQSGLRDTSIVESRLTFRSPLEEDNESEDVPFMWLSRDKPPEKPAPFIPLPPPQTRSFHALGDQSEEGSVEPKILGREMFPAMVSSISAVGYAPLPPLSTLLVSPTKRGGKGNEVGRKQQRTTSGSGRFNPMGGRSVSSSAAAAVESATPTVDLKADQVDYDDIYCDEEPGQVLELDKRGEEEGVSKLGRIGSRWVETQVVDVIPNLRSDKTNR